MRSKIVQHHRAEHRALVIDQDEDDGPIAEQVPQPDGVTLLVVEDQVGGNHGPQFLIDADILENRGFVCGGGDHQLGRRGDVLSEGCAAQAQC